MSRAMRRLQSPIVRFAVLALLLAFASALDASKASFATKLAEPAIPSTSPEHSIPSVTGPAKAQVIDWFQGLDSKYQRLITIILCTVMMLIGVFFVLFGYRIFRPALATVGFVIIFVILWLVLTVYAPKLKWWAVLLISLAGGLVAALLCFFIYFIGIAFLGSALGFIIATLILSTPFGTKVVTNYWGHFGIILGFTVIFSVVALLLQRLIIIIGTSALGAYLFCNAIDIAWLHTGILTDIIVKFFTRKIHDIPIYNTASGYGLLGGSIAIILFGVVVQYGITARDFDHREALRKRRQAVEEGEGLLVNAYYGGN